MSQLLFQSRPVTGIDVTRDHVFVSEGPGLAVYTTEALERVCQRMIFPHDKSIQGFSIYSGSSQDLIFVYGRTCWRIVSYDRSDTIRSVALPTGSTAQASYIAARWLNQGRKLAAVTDENILHIFSWSTDSDDVAEIIEIRGVQTSLFSATLTGDTDEDLVVFGGTNLSQIYVWAPKDLKRTYHVVVEGIKGSVLSLKYCETNGILVASSDQRSVFAWKLCSDEQSDLPLSAALKENKVCVQLVAEMIGHTGRVWDVDISGDYIASAGQDSNLLLWDRTGRLLKIFCGQSVFSLRCCKFTADSSEVICGSDDSSIVAWKVADNSTVNTVKVTGDSADEGYPKQVLHFESSNFLVTLSSGILVIVGADGRQHEVFRDLELVSYSICEFSRNRNFLAIGSKTGVIYVLRLHENGSHKYEKIQVIEVDSKVVSIHWISSSSFVAATCTTVYLVTESVEAQEWSTVRQLTILWKDKPGVAGAIGLKSTSGEDFLVLGDEWGHLHLFRLDCDTPVFTHHKVHGSYGVCDLKHGNFQDEFWSVGRNRAILNLKLTSEPSLICIHSIDSCLNWNSRLITTPSRSFLCGFSENDFVVIDMIQDYIVKKFPCGGAHRSWDVAVSDEIINFAFIRHKELTVAQMELDSRSLKAGIFGGKTINVVTVCPDISTTGASEETSFCIITGGEDCALRLSRILSKEIGGMPYSVGATRLAKFKGHASSVRVVKWCLLSETSMLVLSGGGRSQVVASLIQNFDGHLVWSKKSTISLQSTSEGSEFADLDMRIMDISIADKVGSTVTLLCACSDGDLRMLQLKEKFSVLRTFSHHGSPKTSVIHSVSCVSVQPSFTCWTTSSGELVLDSRLENNDTFFVQRTNNASITAMALAVFSLVNQIVVTGSDDGILNVFQIIQCEGSESECEPRLLHSDNVNHHAAINAVKIEKKFIFAASADQVVTIRNLSGSKVKKVVCGVCDIQDLAVITHSSFPNSILAVLVGQGLEICSLDLTDFVTNLA